MWGNNKIIWKSGTPNSVGRGAVNSNNEIIPELEFQQKRIKDGVAKRCWEWNHVTKIPEAKKPPVFEIKKEGWLFLNGYLGEGQQRALSYYIGELFYDEANEIFTDKWAQTTVWTLSDSVVSRRISEDARYVGEAFVDSNWDNTIYGGVEWSMYEPLYDGTKELVFNQEATISTEDWREKLLFNETDYLILAPFPCGIDYLKRFDYQSLTKSSYDKTRDSTYYQQVAKDFFEPRVFDDNFFKDGAFKGVHICEECGTKYATAELDVDKEKLKIMGVIFDQNGSTDYQTIAKFNNEPVKKIIGKNVEDDFYLTDSDEELSKYINTIDKDFPFEILAAGNKTNKNLPILHSNQADIYLLFSTNDFDVTQYEYNPFFEVNAGHSNFGNLNYEITLDFVNPIKPKSKKRKSLKDYDINEYFKNNKISFKSFNRKIEYTGIYNKELNKLVESVNYSEDYIYNIESAKHYCKAFGKYSLETCIKNSSTIPKKLCFVNPGHYYDERHFKKKTTIKTKAFVYVSPLDNLYQHGYESIEATPYYIQNYSTKIINSDRLGSKTYAMSYVPQKFTFHSFKLKKIDENYIGKYLSDADDTMMKKIGSLPNSTRKYYNEGAPEMGIPPTETEEISKYEVYQIHKDGSIGIFKDGGSNNLAEKNNETELSRPVYKKSTTRLHTASGYGGGYKYSGYTCGVKENRLRLLSTYANPTKIVYNFQGVYYFKNYKIYDYSLICKYKTGENIVNEEVILTLIPVGDNYSHTDQFGNVEESIFEGFIGNAGLVSALTTDKGTIYCQYNSKNIPGFTLNKIVYLYPITGANTYVGEGVLTYDGGFYSIYEPGDNLKWATLDYITPRENVIETINYDILYKDSYTLYFNRFANKTKFHWQPYLELLVAEYFIEGLFIEFYTSSSLFKAKKQNSTLNNWSKYDDRMNNWNGVVTTLSPIMRPWVESIVTFTGLTPRIYNQRPFEFSNLPGVSGVKANYYNRFYQNGTAYVNYLCEGIYPTATVGCAYFVNSFVSTMEEGFSGVQIKLNNVFDDENLRVSNGFNLPCDTALIAKVDVNAKTIIEHANVFTKDNDLGYDINKGVFPIIKSFWQSKGENKVVHNAIFAIETQHLIEGPDLYFSYGPNDMPPGLEENYVGYKSRGLLISVGAGGTNTNYFVGQEAGFFDYFPPQNSKRFPINANRAYDDDPWELTEEVGYYWQFEEAFNRLELSGEYTFATQLAAKMSFAVRVGDNTSVLLMLAYDIDKWKPNDDDKPTRYEFVIAPEEEFGFKAAFFTAEFCSTGDLVSFPHPFKDFQMQKALRPLVENSKLWTSSDLKKAGRKFFEYEKKKYEGITLPNSFTDKKWGERVQYEFEEIDTNNIYRGVVRLVRWRTFTWKEKKDDKYIEHQDAIAECAVAYDNGQTTTPDSDYVDLFYTGKDTVLLRFYRDDSVLEKKKNGVEVCKGEVCVENLAVPEMLVWSKMKTDDTGKIATSEDYLLKLLKLGIFDVVTLHQKSEEKDPDDKFEVLAMPVFADDGKTYFAVSKNCKNWEISGVVGDGFLSHSAAGDKSSAPTKKE